MLEKVALMSQLCIQENNHCLLLRERAPGKYGNWRKLNENEKKQIINDLQEEEKEIRKKFLFLFLILELFEKGT